MPPKKRPRDPKPARSPRSAPAGPDARRIVWVAVALAVVTLVVYAQVQRFPFISNFDDDQYVTRNPHVVSGWSSDNVAWAFTHATAGNWHPVTMLSHMTDVALFGLDPGRHHLVNVLLHVVNVVLVLVVFVAYTGRLWPSAFVAGMFALHPQHVESVAWIAERKDVLSALFWLVTLLLYRRWVGSGRRSDFALACGVYALGLMSKPMVVTLPAVLVLLDAWPLGRIDGTPAGTSRTRVPWTRSVTEKWPFFALSAGCVAATLWAQRSAGAILTAPLAMRLSTAVVATMRYLGKLVAPVGLSFLYPYEIHIPWPEVAAAAAGVTVLTALAIAMRRRAPYVTFGWLWYLVTVAPVIGVVQAGSQSMADRYTYLPHLGLYVMVAWGVAAWAASARVPRAAVAAAAALVLAACAAATWRQIGTWNGGERLFLHGLQVTRGNYVAENDYAVALMQRGDIAEARDHFERAVSYNPKYTNALVNLGITEAQLGHLDRAGDALSRARAVEPRNPRVLLNVANLLLRQQRADQAVATLETAVALDPSSATGHRLLSEAYDALGRTLESQGRWRDALASFENAMRANPEHPTAATDADRARRALEGAAAPSGAGAPPSR